MFDMFDDLHQESMRNRMEFIVNTRLTADKEDPRDTEIFGQSPRPELTPWGNPAAVFDEMD